MTREVEGWNQGHIACQWQTVARSLVDSSWGAVPPPLPAHFSLFALPPLPCNLLAALSLSWPPKAVPRASRGAGPAWSRPCKTSTFPNRML